MKAYQDHCPIADKGKAVPHPKRPSHHTWRGRGMTIGFSRDEIRQSKNKLAKRKRHEEKIKGLASVHIGMFAAIMCALGFRGRR